MNFELVLKQLLEGFERLNIRYATAGGFALGALGAQRMTNDLDFLVHHEDLSRLHGLMTGMKYERIFESENISQYRGETTLWGYVDFIHAFRPLALRMLKEALTQTVLEGKHTLRVLRAEDIIGLKVQAIANSPEKRKEKDEPDILALMRANQGNMDWSRIEEYYKLFNMGEDFSRLEQRFKNA